MDLTQDQLAAVLQAALTEFRHRFGPGLTAERLLILLAVVKSPGVNQADLAERYVKGMSQAGISRNVLDLTDQASTRDAQGRPLPGPGLVEQRPDPAYRKRNVIYPTSKGLALLNSVTDTVNRKVSRKFS